MIDHVYPDGSRGHEYEVGDRVICQREDYFFCSGGERRAKLTVGVKGTVLELKPYNKDSTYHTTFIYVRLDNGLLTKNLMSGFDPDCKPRAEVQAKD